MSAPSPRNASGSRRPFGKDADRATHLILSAALSAFGTQGFKATSLSEVAMRAGVSRPTLYARYPDKTHLFRAVIEQGYRDAIGAARRTVEAGGSFRETLTSVLLEYYGGLFDRFHDLPQIDDLTLVQSEHAHDLVAASRLRIRKLLTRVIRDADDAGTISIVRLEMPIAQVVDLIRLAPLAFKPPGTTRAQYRRRLKNLASVTAAGLESA